MDRLRAAGWRVRVLVRHSAGNGADAVAGSLEDDAALDALVAGAHVVVHCAGLTKARTAAEFQAVNVAGAARLGRAIRRAAPGARIVAVSSLAAREPGLSPYAVSKAAGEEALLEHADAGGWVVLRPCALYGPGDVATLPVFRAARMPLVPIPRQPAARLALLHVDDAAAAVLAAAGSTVGGQVWEVGDGCLGWEAIVHAAARALGREVATLPVPRWALAGLMGLARRLGVVSPFSSPGKLAELLHADWTCAPQRLPPGDLWRPTIGLSEGFAATVSWYRLHKWL
ncbi:MAG: NAD(P)-dependent oxidoreductase [Magnetospirillum sp.]|nr:NAD(P)-dependent oxidoreductase [Magnetospirillum sp.]